MNKRVARVIAGPALGVLVLLGAVHAAADRPGGAQQPAARSALCPKIYTTAWGEDGGDPRRCQLDN